MPPESIRVKGAKLHNLKNIDVEIPKNKLTVITGLSGSGKSSLAFDTIYAEGQRRYVESLSTYARQFLQLTEKPDVESIDGLSPAISIDQKTAPKNPRSTVGTITEVYDYLRLLFARVGTPYDPETGAPLTKQTTSQMVSKLMTLEAGQKIMLLAPVIDGRKGQHKSVFEDIKKDGFVRVRIDGEIFTIVNLPELDEKKSHTIEIVVDRLVTKDYSQQDTEADKSRLGDSVETTVKFGNGKMRILFVESGETLEFSEKYASDTGMTSLGELEPRMFSFNSPHGACQACHGLGYRQTLKLDLIVPNKKLSVSEGAIMPWSSSAASSGWYAKLLEAVFKSHGFDIDAPVSKLPAEALEIVFYGTDDQTYDVLAPNSSSMRGQHISTKFEGVIPNLERRYNESDSDFTKRKIEAYMKNERCTACNGSRLRREILHVLINKKSIIDVTEMTIEQAYDFIGNLELDETQAQIASMIVSEIRARLNFLLDVGLSYLSLDRRANTLSGGEAQRIRLATQIGSKLSGVLYVLDEPSIGLHQNDNDRLIQTLKELRDLGNTVIVVEHDNDTILAADHIIDIGPGAGVHGGEVIFSGTPEQIMADSTSETGAFLSGRKSIEIPKKRRPGNGKAIRIVNAQEHNLQNIDVEFPLGKFIAVTGVSGSGKSTLVNGILLKAVSAEVFARSKAEPGKHERIEGLEHVDKVINIDQSPIGRTPRSNPATYTGVFTDIRSIMSQTQEARMRGYKPGRFSFNVKGGRCEACSGDGVKKIEMHFLPDVYVTCDECKGKRYNQETLEITYRGKNISEILDMTVEEALSFFNAIPQIKNKLQTLCSVGLDYIGLGQQANTLSGGEAQRIKLATELSKRSTGKTIYILDEPTTGLHFGDVKKLLMVLQKLVDKGNTVLTIEHNLDVVKCVDHVIDIGPLGGHYGGQIVCEGTPEEVAKHPDSVTGKWLKKYYQKTQT